jgi:hypothetical protein
VAGKIGAEAVECMTIEAIKPKGVSFDANATPAPTKSTTSIKLTGRAEEATTIKPEVLEPWAESMAWSELKTPPPPLVHCHERLRCDALS